MKNKLKRILAALMTSTMLMGTFTVAMPMTVAYAADEYEDVEPDDDGGGGGDDDESGGNENDDDGDVAISFIDEDNMIATYNSYETYRKVSMYYNNTADSSGNRILDKTYKCFAIKWGDNNVSIYIDREKYEGNNSTFSDSDREKSKGQMLNQLAAIEMPTEATKKISDDLRDKEYLQLDDADLLVLMFHDTKADLSGALGWFTPFKGTVGMILGIGVVIIMVLLIASTVFDLVYIGLPMARNALDGKAEESGKEKPFGVSYDAVNVVKKETEGNGKGGGNLYLEYLKKRIATYIILAVCILFLVSGNIASVIQWLLDLVSGIGT